MPRPGQQPHNGLEFLVGEPVAGQPHFELLLQSAHPQQRKAFITEPNDFLFQQLEGRARIERNERMKGEGGWGRAQRASSNVFSRQIIEPLRLNLINTNRHIPTTQIPSRARPLPFFRFLNKPASNRIHGDVVNHVHQRIRLDDIPIKTATRLPKQPLVLLTAFTRSLWNPIRHLSQQILDRLATNRSLDSTRTSTHERAPARCSFCDVVVFEP